MRFSALFIVAAIASPFGAMAATCSKQSGCKQCESKDTMYVFLFYFSDTSQGLLDVVLLYA